MCLSGWWDLALFWEMLISIINLLSPAPFATIERAGA